MVDYAFEDKMTWFNQLLWLFLILEFEVTMGDEDWEAEIIKPHVSSYVPGVEKVKELQHLGLRMLLIFFF